MEDYSKLLNEQQQAAVFAPPGPTLILAGPGSGKTRVLSYRIAYLIGVMNVPAYHLLAVTFTNKAARQMGERVRGLVGDQAEGIWLGTFHAICGRILRREAELLPLSKDFVIFDADDQLHLMKEILRENNLDEKLYRPASCLDAISRAKNELISAENFPVKTYRDEQTQRLYQAYQKALLRNNAVDFDDMLFYTNSLLENWPTVREVYAHKFEHLMVDEFQDTNMAQYSILRNLAAGHRNLYVVGDEDQSIYRWRGADYHNIERMRHDFKGTRTILLEENYRSSQNILDASMAIIDKNEKRTRKKLFTQANRGEKVQLLVAQDDRDEATMVVGNIKAAVARKEAKASEFAIMYRTNAQSRLFEEAFRRDGLSYRLVGAQRFYGRREVKDMIAFMRLCHNLRDEISLRRVINLPPRGIGEKTLQSLQLAALSRGVSMGDILVELAEGRPETLEALGKDGQRLAGFGRFLATWRSLLDEGAPLSQLFDRVLQDTGYQVYIQDKSEEGQDRWDNVLELRTVVLEYDLLGLSAFLETMALVADQDTLPDDFNAPIMLTLHAAKGLEFDNVFIVGLDENLLPHSRAKAEEEDLAEERRLLYVGMTRARKKLSLTRALRRRNPYGGYEETQASRFLDDLPAKLVQGSARSYPSRLSGMGEREKRSRWESPARVMAPQESRAVKKTYQTGMQVLHAVYGRGVVKSSRVEHGDETVEIYFEGHGLKALVASLAKLEIISK